MPVPGEYLYSRVDPYSPYNPWHPINQGRYYWWFAAPGLALRGSRFIDLMGRNHGYYQGNQDWSWDQFGGTCPSFNGSTDYVNCGTDLPVGTADFTFAISFRTNTPNATTSYAMTKSVLGASPGRWGVGINDGSTGVAALLTNDTAGDGVQTGFLTGYADGNWHRALVSVQRASIATLYMDGGVKSSTVDISGAVGNDWTTTDVLMLGAYNDSSGGANPPSLWWKGSLNDATVWLGRAFTADQAAQEWQLARTGYRVPNSPLDWISTRTWFTPTSPPPPPPPTTVVFRKTLSGIGGRVGARQAQGGG